MLREMMRWSGFAILFACGLVVVGALGLSRFGSASFDPAKMFSSVGFLLVQTLGPIVLWVVLTNYLPALRRHFALEVVAFPFVVAFVGWVAEVLLGQPSWPTRIDVFALSLVGWLGFSWALLAARWVADWLLPLRQQASTN